MVVDVLGVVPVGLVGLAALDASAVAKHHTFAAVGFDGSAAAVVADVSLELVVATADSVVVAAASAAAARSPWSGPAGSAAAAPRRWRCPAARWTWAGSSWARSARCRSWASHPGLASADFVVAVATADFVVEIAVVEAAAAWRAPCRTGPASCPSPGCGCA